MAFVAEGVNASLVVDVSVSSGVSVTHLVNVSVVVMVCVSTTASESAVALVRWVVVLTPMQAQAEVRSVGCGTVDSPARQARGGLGEHFLLLLSWFPGGPRGDSGTSASPVVVAVTVAVSVTASLTVLSRL